MSGNTLVKPLKGFDPNSSLTVDESFAHLIKSGVSDIIGGDVDVSAPAQVNGNAGKEFGILRTGGPIHSGCTRIELKNGRSVFAVVNLRGELFFFEPAREGLRVSGKIMLHGDLYSPPVYHDGIIYCVSREGAVFAVDTGLKEAQSDPELLSGRIIWQKKMKKGIFTEPVASGKVLLVTPLDGVYAFGAFNGPDRKIGETLWGLPVNGTVSTPVINSGMLFIGSEEKKILAFNYGGNKLKKLWEYDLSGICRSKLFVSDKNKQVVAGTIDGFVYSVDQQSGVYKWDFPVMAPVLSTIVSGDVNGEELFLFGADNGYFYALDSAGKKIWEFRADGKIRTEALVLGGRVYFGSEDNSLYALDIKSGKPVFTFICNGNIYGKPVIHEGRVYFGSMDGIIHSVYI